MNRQILTKIHLLLATFMFPVALMFLVTGGLYTWGFKGSYVPQEYELSLQVPLTEDVTLMSDIAEAKLQSLAIAVPSGSAKVKTMGSAFELEWTGSARDVILAPTADPLVAKLTVKETTWYRNLVQLHKAKGGQLFKVYAALLAASLFVMLLSGFLLAWQVPRYRSLAGAATAAGLLVFAAVVIGS